MSARRLGALFRRVVQEIRRDRPSLALLFIAPILVTGLLTFILREGQGPALDAVLVNGLGPAGEAVVDGLRDAVEADGGSLREVPDEAAARQAVIDDDASIAVILAPPSGGRVPRITLLTYGLDQQGDAGRLAALQRALIGSVAAAGGLALPSIEHDTIYGVPSNDPMTSFAPAIVGFFTYFFVYLLTGVSFLRERTGGTLERLMATPVTRGEIVSGYTLGFVLFATLQVAILLAWVLGEVTVPAIGPMPEFSLGLGVASAGSPLLAFAVVVMLALGAVSLGIFLSTFARTELQIIQFIPLVLVPQFLLSGVLFPVSSLPEIIQPFVKVMPLNYAVDGLRQVFVRGADLSVPELQVDLLVLAGVAVFFAIIASLTIRREVA
ncbi:MAG TPA: ABC transporter permease [Candidatus Limnocylindria bacterium]|jgi:ABC-2 type transport system permease protein|nr:ABC transporter permease [Candidatus Limnocylindria bacterium]